MNILNQKSNNKNIIYFIYIIYSYILYVKVDTVYKQTQQVLIKFYDFVIY